MAAPSTAYWVGSDGNVYAKGSDFNGVQNIGTGTVRADGSVAVTHQGGTTTYLHPDQLIPNPGNPTLQGTPPVQTATSSSSSSDANAAIARQNDIDTQLANLSGAQTQGTKGMSAVDADLATLQGEYGSEAKDAADESAAQGVTNTQNLQKNKEVALTNAAQGKQGLYGTLASLGALNGSGTVLADRAVQAGANEDLSSAADTYGQNQTSITAALDAFNKENDKRTTQAEQEAAAEKQSVQNTALSNQQKAYQALAGDYAQEGDSANASKYTTLGNGLTGQIVDSGVPSNALSYSGLTFTPTTLSNYLAGAQTNVSTTPSTNGQPTNLIATNATTKKKQTQTAAPVS